MGKEEEKSNVKPQEKVIKPFVVDDPSQIQQPPLHYDTKPKDTRAVQREDQQHWIK